MYAAMHEKERDGRARMNAGDAKKCSAIRLLTAKGDGNKESRRARRINEDECRREKLGKGRVMALVAETGWNDVNPWSKDVEPAEYPSIQDTMKVRLLDEYRLDTNAVLRGRRGEKVGKFSEEDDNDRGSRTSRQEDECRRRRPEVAGRLDEIANDRTEQGRRRTRESRRLGRTGASCRRREVLLTRREGKETRSSEVWNSEGAYDRWTWDTSSVCGVAIRMSGARKPNPIRREREAGFGGQDEGRGKYCRGFSWTRSVSRMIELRVDLDGGFSCNVGEEGHASLKLHVSSMWSIEAEAGRRRRQKSSPVHPGGVTNPINLWRARTSDRKAREITGFGAVDE
ncbi:hypothetical protein R3P38DRAFT_3359742 [Favolaschia claudopus]|uniref:Uncharacterized protein n=1 Tax=Favolaschia claudopus TaxID=2862362 RepID=A0AAW0AZ88_9AGAR